MKKLILIVFPCVIGGILSACSNSKTITYSNASFTEKDEIMITTNNGYVSTSVVGHGGTLANVEKQALYKRKFADTEKKLKAIPDIQIRTVQDENGGEFIAVVENDILFEHNSFDITADASTILSELASIINDNMPGTAVQVIGYTDNTGTVDYNLKLSNFRAGSVANYLREFGIQNVSELGKGIDNPVASNSTEDGRRKNRRVEIKLSTENDL